MPDVKPNESEDDFVKRCIPVVIEEGTAEDGSQAAAVCHSMWREAKKNMSDTFLKAIKARGRKAEPFGYGIVTADVYVRTLLERAGSDACYQYAASKQASFDDLLRKAATTLVYSNPEMTVKELRAPLSNGAELPKNTLMVFRHVLTTPREDRDGDILRSEGATLDPKMLLLWQHVHTLPIGKYLATNSHDDKGVIVTSAIVDINATAHDAAVMLDNGMGRFSHGFRAIEFEQRKSSGDVEAGSFDIKRFEVMEESVISVPSNVDANTEEILLSLVEGGKLTSPMLKRIGEGIRDKRSTRVPITVDVKLLVDGKEVRHGGEPGPRAAEGAGQVAAGGAPEKTDDGSDQGTSKAAGDAQVKRAPGKPVWLTVAQMRAVCEQCAEEMTRRNLSRVNLKEMPAQMLSGLCDKLGGDPGFFTNCMDTSFGDFDPGDKESYCAWLHYECTGTWPGEHTGKSKYYADLAPMGMSRTPPPKSVLEACAKICTECASQCRATADNPTVDNMAKCAAVCHGCAGLCDSCNCGCCRICASACHACAYVCESTDIEACREACHACAAVCDECGRMCAEMAGQAKSVDGTKRGRVLSNANESKIRDAKDNIVEAVGMDISRPAKALLREAGRGLDEVLASLGEPEGEAMTVPQAVGFVLAMATKQERERLSAALEAIEQQERDRPLVEQYRALVGARP